MDRYEYSPDSDELVEEPRKPSKFSIYLLRLLAFVMLLVLVGGTFRYYQKGAMVRIVGINDHISKLKVVQANITVRPAFGAQSEAEQDFYFGVKPPINLPVEGGACYRVLVEAQGYHSWENIFCPSVSENIFIEIDLIPDDLPPARPKLFET